MFRQTLLSIILISSYASTHAAETTTSLAKLGNALYHDTQLSKNGTQSCSTCHNPKHGFIDNRDNGVKGSASLGDDGHSIGDRNAPTAAYASFSPAFHYDSKTHQYTGGQFLDGRELTLAGQAGGPPTNPIEMGMKDKAAIVSRLQENPFYVSQFKAHFGDKIFDDVDQAYSAMTKSIEAFEKTDLFAPFDSKYDRYLKGEYTLTDQEELGRSLFFSNNNTNCATCHKLKEIEDQAGETFTNYQYHNIGVPKNTALRNINGKTATHIDHGLLENPAITDPQHDGKYKVPTLRNIAVTGPYMHNGVFHDLTTVLAFYDKFNNRKRATNPETGKPWAAAEVPNTVNKKDLKAKKLTDAKIAALEAFLNTLTDKRFESLLK